jgi:carbon monoxide dehydrogenase subunit G
MGLQIEKSFTVRAPKSAVWAFLTDPYKVASCLPGAAIVEKLDDASYVGTITIKVGPVTASYRGKMRFERLDEAAGEAEIVASGQETRGKGGADMRMKSRVALREPGTTEVTVTSDVNVMGVLAQFGRGMIQDVSDQLFGRFTEAMRRQLEGTPAGPGAPAATATMATPAAGSAAPASTSAPTPPPMASPTAPTAPWPAPDPTGATARPTASPPPDSTAAASGSAASPPPTPAAAQPPAAAPVPPAAPRGPAAPPHPSTPAPAEALDVGALGAAAAARAAARTLRRPGFWAAVAAIALLVYWWFFC